MCQRCIATENVNDLLIPHQASVLGFGIGPRLSESAFGVGSPRPVPSRTQELETRESHLRENTRKKRE